MGNFTNEPIDLSQLPRYETLSFSSLHPSYWKVMVINIAMFFVLLTTGAALGIIFDAEIRENTFFLIIALIVLLVLVIIFARLSFCKRGYVFRNHDVIYRTGIIATNTVIIPYNRVQHVALHEGFVARFFGLAKVEIFTAGGKGSDIQIPGIEKDKAEDIKQLLMGKIQKQL
ncbi:PH domain-containing protein [Flavobacterium silvisoli]|uniref:PH domain-containing protein n=1 Tax=Flavobacterium silvisoli TaxID=2529433 RepID=A0A4Q9Z1K7_9FLAO|nr:PH domain-containing protein [Flavobacterium silvisoli]TBX69944.1 PH domain-containing protein [Flavobacterium silvisoli]